MTVHERDLVADEIAIARSVLYASLFDYPLTLEQLHESLLRRSLSHQEILVAYRSSDTLQAMLDYTDGFFYPKGRHDLVATRQERESRSRSFLAAHDRLLRLVCSLPFVRMVALSGSVAHLNCEERCDLDLFVIAREGRVWSVTVAIVLLAKMLHLRRSVCANFVLADSRLALEQRDLFSASQIIHLRPLVGYPVYKAFIDANPFVAHLYPNFRPSDARLWPIGASPRAQIWKPRLETMLALPSRIVEVVARKAYRWYLKRRASSWRSPEQVVLQRDCLKLHTQSHRRSILDRFDEAVHVAFEQARPAPRARAVSDGTRR